MCTEIALPKDRVSLKLFFFFFSFFGQGCDGHLLSVTPQTLSSMQKTNRSSKLNSIIKIWICRETCEKLIRYNVLFTQDSV